MYTSFQLSVICSCSNQALLSPGQQCEICMGMVEGPQKTSEEGSFFEVDYFEALEEQLSKEDLAA